MKNRIRNHLRLVFILASGLITPDFQFSALAAAIPPDLSGKSAGKDSVYRVKYSGIVRDYMRHERIPGLSLAMVDTSGVLWSCSLGVRDTLNNNPVDPETMFGIASCTKPLTATILLNAVQAGILALDTPIITYLPEIHFNSHYEPFPERKITLRHLLSHRSGLPHEAPLGNNWDGVNCSLEEHIQSLNGTWLKHPVGQRNDYSGSGFDLAAYILQRVMKKPYEECARELLFVPLGMMRTTVDPAEVFADSNRAAGHTRRYHNPPPVFIPLYGGGAVCSTADDLAKFILNHLKVFSDRSVAESDFKYIKEMYLIQGKEAGQLNGYGLGINCWHAFGNEYFRSCRMLHTGGGTGFSSVMEWFPEQGCGIVILTNSWDADPLELADTLMTLLFTSRKIVLKRNTTMESIIRGSEPCIPDSACLGDYGVFRLTGSQGNYGISMEKNTDYPFFFFSPQAGYFYPENGEPNIIRFHPGVTGQADYATSMKRGFVYNKVSPQSATKFRDTGYMKYTGRYIMRRWGEPVDTICIDLRKEGLFFNDVRLEEVAPGIFYQVNTWQNGEVIDFSQERPMYRNISLEKMYKAGLQKKPTGFSETNSSGLPVQKTIYYQEPWMLIYHFVLSSDLSSG
ncbi:MAG: class A beta-lactamase-related serine hydrolase [Alphaproteobacteria bacterium]|nr:class A beta-lactamase-related serine hydrolase [Alphaproteobacteria bacterium]